MTNTDFIIELFNNIKDVRNLGEINKDTIKIILSNKEVEKGIRIIFNSNQIFNTRPTLELVSFERRLICHINTKGVIIERIRDTLVTELKGE